jgi:hypothetical protein
MKFIRRIARYFILDHRRNEDILEEITVDTVQKKSVQYKQKQLNSVTKMEVIWYPEQLDYRPIDGRRPGRPLKRPLDGYSREAETGHLLA